MRGHFEAPRKAVQKVARAFMALVLAMTGSFAAVPAYAADPPPPQAVDDSTDQTWQDQWEASVQYSGVDRKQAQITLKRMPAQPHPVEFIVTVDGTVGKLWNSVESVIRGNGSDMLFGNGLQSKLHIVEYGEDVQDSGEMGDADEVNGFLDSFSRSGEEESPDELAALQTVIDKVKAAPAPAPASGDRDEYSLIVMWAFGSTLNKPADQIEQKLIELKAALDEKNGALVTVQRLDSLGDPNELCANYATSYVPRGETEPVPAAYVSNRDDNWNDPEGVGVGTEVHIDNVFDWGVFDEWGQGTAFDLDLSDSQTLVERITDAQVYQSYRYDNVGEEAIEGSNNKIRRIEIHEDGLGIHVPYTYYQHGVRRETGLEIVLTVDLNESVFERQQVFGQQVITFDQGVYAGSFDEQTRTGTMSFPEVTLDRQRYGVSYNLGEGVSGEVPETQWALPGESVTLDDGAGIVNNSGEPISGWIETENSENPGKRYSPGEEMPMPEGHVELSPVWGMVDVELDWELVYLQDESSQMMEDPGLNGVFDFSDVEVNDQTVGDKVRSITFDNESLGYVVRPDDPNDPLRVDLDPAVGAAYARIIGAAPDGDAPADGALAEGAAPVIAYLKEKADEPGYFDMVVTAPGGVALPANCLGLFSDLMVSGEGGNITVTPQSGWQKNLQTIDFAGNVDSSQVENMNMMFTFCTSLTEIKGLEGLDTGNVTDMGNLFRQCSSLTSLDVSSFDMRNCQNASNMFSYCHNLESVDVNWNHGSEEGDPASVEDNLTNVTNMNWIFGQCWNLSSINGVQYWRLPEVRTLRSAFRECRSLTELDISSWNPEKVTTISQMFDGHEMSATGYPQPPEEPMGLQELTIEGWNVPELREAEDVFTFCRSLESIDLSTWKMESLTEASNFIDWGRLKFSSSDEIRQAVNPKVIKFPQGFFNKLGEGFEVSDEVVTMGNTLEFVDMSYGRLNEESYLFDLGFYWKLESGDPAPDCQAVLNGWTVNRPSGSLKTNEAPINYAVAECVVQANDWNLMGSPLNLPSLLSHWPKLKTFSGWTGLEGVTSFESLFSKNAALTEVSITDADLSSVQSFEDMFTPSSTGAAPITSIDLTGWTVSDESLITKSMFEGAVQAGRITSATNLVVSDDSTGAALLQAFGDALASVQAESGVVAESVEGETVAATDAPAQAAVDEPAETGSNVASEIAQASASSDVDEGDEALEGWEYGTPLPVSSETASVLAEPQESSSPGIRYYEQSTPKGTQVKLRATTRYLGDSGAGSGRLDLLVPLPESINAVPDGEIELGNFEYVTEPTGEAMGGIVLKEPAFEERGGSTCLTASFGNMAAGTQIEVSFLIELGEPSVSSSEGSDLWFINALLDEGAVRHAVSDTLCFWDGASEPGEDHLVRYRFLPFAPSDVSLPEAEAHAAGEAVTLPSEPSSQYPYYQWGGWQVNPDQGVVVEDGSFTMPDNNVDITGLWSIDSATAPKVHVGYELASNLVPPELAGQIPQGEDVPLGSEHQIVAWAEGLERDYHSFSGWTPSLTIDNRKIEGAESADTPGVWVFKDASRTYMINLNSGKIDTMQFREALEQDGSQVSVTLSGAWTPWKGTISFDANGGVGEMSSMTDVEHYSKETLPAVEFTYEDREFAGWSLTPDGPVAYADGASAEGIIVSDGQEVTLYAVWNRDIVHNVEWRLDKVQADPMPTSVPDGDSLSCALIPSPECTIDSVRVNMGGVDVTETAWNAGTGRVEITEVLGNVVIEASAQPTVPPEPLVVPVTYELDGATVSPMPDAVAVGGSLSLVVTADAGRELGSLSVSVGGAEVLAWPGAAPAAGGATASFDPASGALEVRGVDGPVVVRASAQPTVPPEPLVVPVTYELDGATVSPMPDAVAVGGSLSLVVTADAGRELGSLSVSVGGAEVLAWPGAAPAAGGATASFDPASGALEVRGVDGPVVVRASAQPTVPPEPGVDSEGEAAKPDSLAPLGDAVGLVMPLVVAVGALVVVVSASLAIRSRR
ncbi:BspA family leucine-rich repeat surface protein [Gordonibacter sp. An230]|uniref:BspA family leucine-rich repeat surface protein n=1 Tax=Gordonibacter sp. An230 TaxID=1965592 RepID=UPI0013A63705|nr:BspA family leucine-rich repeat surface protein [Gordonibacter sp. An230]